MSIYLSFFMVFYMLAFIFYKSWMVDPAVSLHFLKYFKFE